VSERERERDGWFDDCVFGTIECRRDIRMGIQDGRGEGVRQRSCTVGE